MQIAIGSDHHGVELRQRLVKSLEDEGYTVVDVGSFGTESVDYPDIAADVARRVGSGAVDRGVLFCGTGIGMAMAANKIDGVRAAVAHDDSTVRLSRQHNDANVLCLSGDAHDDATIERFIKSWLTTEFEGGRHGRRVEKIASLENAN